MDFFFILNFIALSLDHADRDFPAHRFEMTVTRHWLARLSIIGFRASKIRCISDSNKDIYGSTFAWAVDKFRDKFITDDESERKDFPRLLLVMTSALHPHARLLNAWGFRQLLCTVTRIFVKSLMALSFHFNAELASLKGDTLVFLF